MRPSAATRPDFLAAFDRPFLRSQSCAACISPLLSLSAALQSIIPAPVDSRSSLTIWAVIFAIEIFLHASQANDKPVTVELLCRQLFGFLDPAADTTGQAHFF